MVPSNEHVDVLVVTALQLERRAVRAHLYASEVEAVSGLAADRGTAYTAGGRIRVAVIETGPGNVEAATLTTRAEEAFRPDIVAMVGVAGGVKDVAVGDVVAASKVYWIEGGKQGEVLRPRPDFAPVSSSLVQLARAVAADGQWLAPAETHGGGAWAGRSGRAPAAYVAPIVAGEKVLNDRRAETIELVRAVYGDALAVDMEDFGTLRGARSAERTRTIAIRGISDLIDAKEEADVGGSQPLAAANAAAFLFELLALDARSQDAPAKVVTPDDLAAIGAELYSQGPQQDGLWQRAGGDPSRLQPHTTGRAAWWYAAVLLDQGGGGADISVERLLAEMQDDFPQNDRLAALTR